MYLSYRDKAFRNRVFDKITNTIRNNGCVRGIVYILGMIIMHMVIFLQFYFNKYFDTVPNYRISSTFCWTASFHICFLGINIPTHNRKRETITCISCSTIYVHTCKAHIWCLPNTCSFSISGDVLNFNIYT